MDGRMMKLVSDPPPYNSTRTISSAPSFLCAVASAIRDSNRSILEEYLQGCDPLGVDKAFGNVSVQMHWGSSTFDVKPTFHRDYLWRLLTVSATVKGARVLASMDSDSTKITETLLREGDIYLSCPLFQHTPRFFYATPENPSIAVHWSFLVESSDFSQIDDERQYFIENTLASRFDALAEKFQLPSLGKIIQHEALLHAARCATSGFAKLQSLNTLDGLYHLVSNASRTAFRDALRDCSVARMLLHTEAVDASTGGYPPAVRFTINAAGEVQVGLGRRGISQIGEFCISIGKVRFAFIPIRLVPIERGKNMHSNVVIVDTHRKTIHLFEPHGSDPSAAAHGPTFVGYYKKDSYYPNFRRFIREIKFFDDYKIKVPTDYQPAVFGQSQSQVVGSCDRWCSLWSSLFMVFAAKRSPEYFITFVNRLHQCGCLRPWIMFMLSTHQTWMQPNELIQADMFWPGVNGSRSSGPPAPLPPPPPPPAPLPPPYTAREAEDARRMFGSEWPSDTDGDGPVDTNAELKNACQNNPGVTAKGEIWHPGMFTNTSGVFKMREAEDARRMVGFEWPSDTDEDSPVDTDAELKNACQSNLGTTAEGDIWHPGLSSSTSTGQIWRPGVFTPAPSCQPYEPETLDRELELIVQRHNKKRLKKDTEATPKRKIGRPVKFLDPLSKQAIRRARDQQRRVEVLRDPSSRRPRGRPRSKNAKDSKRAAEKRISRVQDQVFKVTSAASQQLAKYSSSHLDSWAEAFGDGPTNTLLNVVRKVASTPGGSKRMPDLAAGELKRQMLEQVGVGTCQMIKEQVGRGMKQTVTKWTSAYVDNIRLFAEEVGLSKRYVEDAQKSVKVAAICRLNYDLKTCGPLYHRAICSQKSKIIECFFLRISTVRSGQRSTKSKRFRELPMTQRQIAVKWYSEFPEYCREAALTWQDWYSNLLNKPKLKTFEALVLNSVKSTPPDTKSLAHELKTRAAEAVKRYQEHLRGSRFRWRGASACHATSQLRYKEYEAQCIAKEAAELDLLSKLDGDDQQITAEEDDIDTTLSCKIIEPPSLKYVLKVIKDLGYTWSSRVHPTECPIHERGPTATALHDKACMELHVQKQVWEKAKEKLNEVASEEKKQVRGKAKEKLNEVASQEMDKLSSAENEARKKMADILSKVRELDSEVKHYQRHCEQYRSCRKTIKQKEDHLKPGEAVLYRDFVAQYMSGGGKLSNLVFVVLWNDTKSEGKYTRVN
jgi:hypothetical protein